MQYQKFDLLIRESRVYIRVIKQWKSRVSTVVDSGKAVILDTGPCLRNKQTTDECPLSVSLLPSRVVCSIT